MKVIHDRAEQMRVRRLRGPLRMILAGGSGCGKSVFTFKLVKYARKMIYPAPKRIVWLYNNDQPLHSCMKGVEFYRGMSGLERLKKPGNPHTLVILDDMMTQAKEAVELFTRHSHHSNLSVVFITQNLFYKGKGFRDITLNANYVVVFKNPRDSSQIRYLSRQMFPQNARFISEAYERVTKKPYSYLFLDLTQEIKDEYRVRTDIFPDQTLKVLNSPSAR